MCPLRGASGKRIGGGGGGGGGGHPDGRTALLGRSWGVLGGSSARDGCEFVTELARGFSPPSRRDKSDQSDPSRRATLTGAMYQRRDPKRDFWGGSLRRRMSHPGGSDASSCVGSGSSSVASTSSREFVLSSSQGCQAIAFRPRGRDDVHAAIERAVELIPPRCPRRVRVRHRQAFRVLTNFLLKS